MKEWVGNVYSGEDQSDGCFQKSEGLAPCKRNYFSQQNVEQKSTKLKRKKFNPQRWKYVKRAQEPTEKAANGQSWNNLRNKIK